MVAAGIHDFLHERLYGVPIGVVGEAEFLLIAVQHALLHLGGIKITAAEAAAMATLAALIAAGAALASAVVLREQAGGADGERGRHGAQGDDAIQFH